MASGRLGANDLAATTNTTVYTVPAGKLATFNVSITNRTSVAVSVRLAVASSSSPTFQSTPPVSGRRCSSPVTTGSIRTKSPHYANLFIPEQKTSYANSAPSGKPHQIRQKRGARTYRGKHVH